MSKSNICWITVSFSHTYECNIRYEKCECCRGRVNNRSNLNFHRLPQRKYSQEWGCSHYWIQKKGCLENKHCYSCWTGLPSCIKMGCSQQFPVHSWCRSFLTFWTCKVSEHSLPSKIKHEVYQLIRFLISSPSISTSNTDTTWMGFLLLLLTLAFWNTAEWWPRGVEMELDSEAFMPSSVWYVTSFHSDVGKITPCLHIPLRQVVSRKGEKGSCPTCCWISERKVLIRMSGCNFYRTALPFVSSRSVCYNHFNDIVLSKGSKDNTVFSVVI